MSTTDEKPPIKCLVWDLDNTLWDGVLLEGDRLDIRPDVRQVLKELDARGILHSVASRNDETAAMEKLSEFGLSDYFLHPQISWNPKSTSIQRIAERLNFSLDTIAFVDDQSFERDEVAFAMPEVMCIDSVYTPTIPRLPRMNPRFVTEDSRLRRAMYMSDVQRSRAEEEFTGSNEAFLATLGMSFSIAPATENDLQRAEELTVRTHQLNSTGYTYSYDELNHLRTSASSRLFVAGLEDRYGTYGKIGLCLVECTKTIWTIKLLLMSCRVISRGVGTILLHHVMRQAKAAGVRLRAEFVSTPRNRMMYITYKFAGFQEIEKQGTTSILEGELQQVPPFPPYVKVDILD